MKKEYLIGWIVIILLIILFFAFPVKKIFLSPDKTRICEVLLENPGKNKVDVVFLTDSVAKNKVEQYSEFLVNLEPFSSNKEKINFFYAGQVDCGIVKDKFLFCYSRNLLRKSAVCKNDYVVVLSEKPARIRSTSYMNVMSINVNHPSSVLLHEFGHAFANLADEYVPSIIPRGAKNCEKDCEGFESIEGCFEGCSKSNYFRSSENSVMRTLSSSEYRKLNTLLIEKNLEKYE